MDVSVAKPVLVGELNPYRADPHFALYCHPPTSAGGRLQRRVLALPRSRYLEIKRHNLCTEKWSAPRARGAAATLMQLYPYPGHKLVLLGAKVCAAFQIVYEPFSTAERGDLEYYVTLPHPSGLSRAWNDPNAFKRAQALMRMEFPDTPFGSYTE